MISSQFIFEDSEFPSCHASTIVQTTDGRILAGWFGGTNEGNCDVEIYLSELTTSGWSKYWVVANGEIGERRLSCYNPVLFQPRNGPLLLFYKIGTEPSLWRGYMKISNDGGWTWSRAMELPCGIFGPIKNKPVELSNGWILCGSSTEMGGWHVHFELTEDFGKTWTVVKVDDPLDIPAIQPSILLLGGRNLRAIGRTQQGKLFVVDSPDNGLTWEKMRLVTVMNPNSGTDALTLNDCRHLLVFNDSSTNRWPLNVAISIDGERWTNVLALEQRPGVGNEGGEFSYPAIIQTADDLVHITYTWNRIKIKHVTLNPHLL